MVTLSTLKPAPGSRHKKKIIGRGEGSGHGGSATKGMKGQSSRSGDGKMVGFEGGQMPLIRVVPKRGFNHKRFTLQSVAINLDQLDKAFPGQEKIEPADLYTKGLIPGYCRRIKILGRGTPSRPLKIQAHAFSSLAVENIKAAGGEAIKIQISKKSAKLREALKFKN